MSTELVVTPAQVLKGATTTLTATFYVDGVATDPGTTTIGIVDATGATVVAALTATTTGATGVRTYALTGQSATQLLTATWTSANYGALDSTHEIVGGFLFSVREARAYDNAELASTDTYPTADIEDARARITDEFGTILGLAPVPRYTRLTLDGSGCQDLTLPSLYVTSVRAVEELDPSTMVWTAYSADELADIQILAGGRIRRASLGIFTCGVGNIRVAYEHGWTHLPGAITQAALAVLRYTLVPSNLSQRALSEQGQFGSIQMARADADRGWHYGLPFVDAALNRYSERVPVIG